MDSIIGQPRAFEVLQSSLQSGRLHHAYIFHGPQGVGKFTMARQFARVLLCRDRATDLAGNIGACGQCDSCRLFGHDSQSPDNHPDLHVINKELAGFSESASVRNSVQKFIAIDVLRQFMVGGHVNDKPFPSVVGRAAQLGKGRVFIIDEAELMNTEGQNAILKTLEEPPPGVTLILISANENKLLPTIRSRCQRVSFSPLNDQTVRGWVQSSGGWTGTDEDLDWLLTFSAGSIGRAKLAIDYDLVRWSHEVLPPLRELARAEFPAGLGGKMAALMNGFAEDWVKRHKNASKDAANKLGAELMWSLITQQMRKAVRQRATRVTPLDPAQVQAQLLPYARAIEAIDTVERELHANVNVAHVCDHAVALLARALAPQPATGRPVGASA